jgi:hypothetical protein
MPGPFRERYCAGQIFTQAVATRVRFVRHGWVGRAARRGGGRAARLGAAGSVSSRAPVHLTVLGGSRSGWLRPGVAGAPR